ncbi:efflux RND transporter periplasmic adaptor subunit [Methylovirgula sp. 4M-Z18]|uniref:efflux RND transporter periplasmic adaptor subunit n=1 Tax=Methylovirgula sp. 4M-Z18 TaxID=2293567 RepID=UPI000E2F6EAD|nr:efflux RND transporter periplasmic adaptor subunit [Methylovirgula sp. 4M-Z18]RFB75672.1 efflux RND transporter periplasmic adaptor subunit [Methylovirgula sp. 4M-Z18]
MRQWYALILAANLGLLTACNQEQKPAAPTALAAVGVQSVETKGVSNSYNFVGRIKAINTVQLRARVEGYLENVLFTEGQDVKSGDLLYQIEKTQYQASVDQASANVAAAQAQEVNAQLQYDRSVQLVKTQAGPQATVDTNQASLDSAKASVLQNKAALTIAQENLGYTDIRAPIDGRIGLTALTKGNLVNAVSGVLATIVSQDPIYVQFPVSVSQLANIRAARQQESGSLIKIEVLVRLSNGQEYSHPGVWNYTDPQVDQQTDTVLMRATLPNPDRQLIDGTFVTVEVKEREQQPRLVVAQAAVQIDQAGSYVLIVNGEHKVEIRRVTTGATTGPDVVVNSGLKQGEAVIVDGVQKVRPGQEVDATPIAARNGG